MKTFIAILRCQHCGGSTPAVLNRIAKMGVNAMHLKNDCDKSGKSLNEANSDGDTWDVIKAPKGYMVQKSEEDES